MRKVKKSLFIMFLVVSLALIYPNMVVNAETNDYSSYVELKDETTGTNKKGESTNTDSSNTNQSSTSTSVTNTTTNSTNRNTTNTNATKTTTNTTKTTTTGTSNNNTTSTKPHQTAGAFISIGYITVLVIATILTGVGYIKHMKYNY